MNFNKTTFTSFFLFISSIALIFKINANELVISQIAGTPDQEVGSVILKRAYEKAGIPVRFLGITGKRSLIESSRGSVDGEVHRIFEIGQSYPTLIRVPTHISYLEQNLFSIKEKNITNCSQLKDHNVGFVRGVKHAEICTKNVKKTKQYSNSLELIRALNEREVDIIITAYFNGLIQIKKLGYVKIKALRPSISKKKLYHYLHKKHSHLVPVLDKVFKEMKQSGEMDKIRSTHMKKLELDASKY